MNFADIVVQSNTVFGYPAHMHKYYEMTLYRPFDGSVTINGNAVDIDCMTVVLVTPSDFHRIDVLNPQNARFVKVAFAENVLDGIISDFSLYEKIDDGDNFAALLFDEILNCDDVQYRRLLINTAVFRLQKCGRHIAPDPFARGCNLAKTAIAEVNENFRGAVSLEQVAAHLAVTPQYLSLVFKKNVGIGFLKYVNNLRLDAAARLLRNTADSVTDICFACGYRNFSHFLRSFKKKYGLTPRNYRENAALDNRRTNFLP